MITNAKFLPWVMALASAVTLYPRAQGVKRRSVLEGRVVDEAMQPVSGAQVCLGQVGNDLVRPVHTVDAVQVVSDAEGRFRASILSRKAYWAWAWKSEARSSVKKDKRAKAQSPYRVTAIAYPLFAGDSCELRLLRSLRYRVPVQFQNRSAWHAVGKLRYFVRAMNATRYSQELVPDESGLVLLPPLPETKLILCATVRERFRVSSLTDGFVVPQKRVVDPIEVALGKPVALRFQVHEKGSAKAPIAGARIYASMLTPPITEVAMTNDRGRATIPSGRFTELQGFDLRIFYCVAPGYAAEFVQPAPASAALAGFGLATKKIPALRISMEKACHLRGRVMDAAGKPISQLRIRYEEGGTKTPFREETLTDAKGNFTFGSCRVDCSIRIRAIFDDLARLDPDPKDEVQADPSILLFAGKSPERASQWTLPDIRLDKLQSLRLAVRDAEGKPVPHACIRLGGPFVFRGKRSEVFTRHEIWTNQEGLARVLVRKREDGSTAKFSCLVEGKLSYRLTSIEIPPGEKPGLHEIRLRPTARVRGHLVDASGKPLVGVVITPSLRWGGNRLDSGPRSLARVLGPSTITTNSAGEFMLTLAQESEYWIQMQKPSSSGRIQAPVMKNTRLRKLRVGKVKTKDWDFVWR